LSGKKNRQFSFSAGTCSKGFLIKVKINHVNGFLASTAKKNFVIVLKVSLKFTGYKRAAISRVCVDLGGVLFLYFGLFEFLYIFQDRCRGLD